MQLTVFLFLTSQARKFPSSHATSSSLSLVPHSGSRSERTEYFTHSRQRADFVKFTSYFKTVKWFSRNAIISCISKMFYATIDARISTAGQAMVGPFLSCLTKLRAIHVCRVLSHSQTKLQFNCSREKECRETVRFKDS